MSRSILFKNFQDVQLGAKIIIQLDIKSIKPYALIAQTKYIQEYIGKELLDLLLSYYTPITPAPGNTRMFNLLPYVQQPLANFTLFLAVHDLDVIIGDNGITTIATEGNNPASAARVENLKNNQEKLAYDAIEILLDFLEENEANYPEWVASEAYSKNTKLFLTSAREFNKYADIDNSRLQYKKLWTKMNNLEMLVIEPALSKDLCDKIKADRNTLTPEYLKIYELVKMAIANISLGEHLDNKKMLSMGEHYLSEIKLILDQNPTLYPEYSNSAVKRTSGLQRYQNEETNSFFLFGSGT